MVFNLVALAVGIPAPASRSRILQGKEMLRQFPVRTPIFSPMGFSIPNRFAEAPTVDRLARPKDQMDVYWFLEQAQGYVSNGELEKFESGRLASPNTHFDPE